MLSINKKVIDQWNSLDQFRRQCIDLNEFGHSENGTFYVHDDKLQDFRCIIKDFKLGLPVSSRKNMVKYLEGITTCVNFSDYFKISLPINKCIFDHLVVVTSSSDKETQNLCAIHEVECVITDDFFKNGAKFNKAAGINKGFKKLHKKDQIIHFDADIVFPIDFRQMLNNSLLSINYMYSWGRVIILDPANYAQWLKLSDKSLLQGNFERGKFRGYGFSQLFHSKCDKLNIYADGIYPETSDNAAGSDIAFSKKWGYHELLNLNHLYCIHLGPSYQNWYGRVSKSIDYFSSIPDRKPDFIVIGGQRCGTTTTFKFLNDHTDVFVPIGKETDYFLQQENEPVKQYLDMFRDRTELVVGEVSPNYTSFIDSKETPRNIHSLIPNVKLIYLIRNPIDRIVSQFKFFVSKNHETSNDINNVALSELYIERSLYGEQLLRYLEYFDVSNFLFLSYDDLKDDPQKFYDELCIFLGIAKMEWKLNGIYNEARDLPVKLNWELTDQNLTKLKKRFDADLKLFCDLTGKNFQFW